MKNRKVLFVATLLVLTILGFAFAALGAAKTEGTAPAVASSAESVPTAATIEVKVGVPAAVTTLVVLTLFVTVVVFGVCALILNEIEGKSVIATIKDFSAMPAPTPGAGKPTQPSRRARASPAPAAGATEAKPRQRKPRKSAAPAAAG